MKRSAEGKSKKPKADVEDKKRGPVAERVKIKGNWEEAMKKALKAPPQKKK